MLSKKAQINYCLKCLDNTESQLFLFCNTLKPEALHRLRVEMKHLNALLHLIWVSTGNKHARKSMKQLKPLFKMAGAIRDAQIKISIAENIQAGHTLFKKRQQHIMNTGTAVLTASAEEQSYILQKVSRRLEKHLSGVPEKKLVRTYLARLEEIKIIFSEKATEKHLHECRKTIKFLLYMHHFLSDCGIALPSINITYLDQLQDAIGGWHDCILLAEIPGMDTDIKTRLQTKKLLSTIHNMTRNFNKKLLSVQAST